MELWGNVESSIDDNALSKKSQEHAFFLYMDNVNMERKLKNRLLMLLTQREQKENRRIKQRELAQAVDVTEHTIRSWLRNDVTKFDAPVVEKLCAYFQCEVGDLLYLEPVETDTK